MAAPSLQPGSTALVGSLSSLMRAPDREKSREGDSQHAPRNVVDTTIQEKLRWQHRLDRREARYRGDAAAGKLFNYGS